MVGLRRWECSECKERIHTRDNRLPLGWVADREGRVFCALERQRRKIEVSVLPANLLSPPDLDVSSANSRARDLIEAVMNHQTWRAK